jgi:hypothetical protein
MVGMTKLHAVVALVVAIALPAWSWRDGSGWLAWTMFAGSQTYRLGVMVTDSDGGLHVVNPDGAREPGVRRCGHLPHGRGALSAGARRVVVPIESADPGRARLPPGSSRGERDHHARGPAHTRRPGRERHRARQLLVKGNPT